MAVAVAAEMVAAETAAAETAAAKTAECAEQGANPSDFIPGPVCHQLCYEFGDLSWSREVDFF
jgi:hypothetical protein